MVLVLLFGVCHLANCAQQLTEEKIKAFEEWYKKRFPTAFNYVRVDLNWTQSRPGLRAVRDFEVSEKEKKRNIDSQNLIGR